ncbi:hypothetical protein K1T71_015034 [Dendrolimus kikuchii]|nr:hypothetical protein K1T71_015034 [Dendrolimus kikuchii]
MEGYLNLQDDRFKSLLKAETNYRKSPKEKVTQGYIETRLETLEELWKEFKDTHKKLISGVKADQHESINYFKNDMYEKFEENYTAYKCLLKDILRAKGLSAKVHHECESETCSPSLFKLPRIQLPNFSGNYAEWQTYYDMFMSMIHENVSLSAVQKLHYLKSTLSGEAESLIRNLPTTELNYEAAWEKLTKRYNNKRYNCNTILKPLFSQKQITQESANAIKHLLDVTSSCLVSLDNLGVPTASWDAFINFYVTSKLDKESHRLWEMHINNVNADSLPTWSELSQFLESRFRTLEMIDGGSTIRHTPSQQKIITKPKVYHTAMHETKTDTGTVSQVASKQCPLCGSSHL